MDLFDRYLAAVKLFLPRAQQDDIIRELSEDLRAQVEDQETALGRRLTFAEQKQLIKGLGHPALLAGRYGPRRHLIGPEIFPFYWLVLKISLGANLVAQAVAIGAAMAAGRSIRFDLRVVSAMFALFIAFGVVTIVFALLDRYRPSTWARRPWDPERLPSLGAPAYRGSHPLTRLIFGALFSLWWVAAKPFPFLVLGGGAGELKFGPAWDAMHPWILVLAIGSVVTALADLARPDWSRLRTATRLAQGAAALVVIFLAFRSWEFVGVANAAASSERLERLVAIVNQSVFWTLLSVGIVGVADGIKAIAGSMKRTRSVLVQ